jgi:hypothetical protein
MILHPAFYIFGDFTHAQTPNAQKNNVTGYTILGDPNKNVKLGFYNIRQEVILIQSIQPCTQSRGCQAAATPPNPNVNKTQIMYTRYQTFCMVYPSATENEV